MEQLAIRDHINMCYVKLSVAITGAFFSGPSNALRTYVMKVL